MGRGRIQGREDWPEGLRQRKVRGKTRYTFIDVGGRESWLPSGTTLDIAIQAANAYNEKHRSLATKISERLDKNNRPIAQWIPLVLKKMKDREKPKKNKWDTFKSDCDKLVKLKGHVYSKDITLDTVNDYLEEYVSNKSANVYNRKISFLEKVFSYMIDMSAMTENPAKLKMRLPKEEKKRLRLTLEHFNAILAVADAPLKIAMLMAIQTTQGVEEIRRMRYADCTWLDEPVTENGLTITGEMKVLRKKSLGKDNSRVIIPISTEIEKIIKYSRADNLASPYIVHKAKKSSNKMSAECNHWTQLTGRNISNMFSEARDAIELDINVPNPKFDLINNPDVPTHLTVKMNTLDKALRPTFHEIRALAIYCYNKLGVNPQVRAAHAETETTEIYLEGHNVWNRAEAAQIEF